MRRKREKEKRERERERERKRKRKSNFSLVVGLPLPHVIARTLADKRQSEKQTTHKGVAEQFEGVFVQCRLVQMSVLPLPLLREGGSGGG
jgi:hypothetical protein